MCKAKILSNNSFGCITTCKKSKQIHVGFGNLLLVLNQNEFSDFKNHISSLHQKHLKEMEEGKKLFIRTKTQNLMIALNVTELNDLKNLLLEASLMFEVEQLLNLIQND